MTAADPAVINIPDSCSRNLVWRRNESITAKNIDVKITPLGKAIEKPLYMSCKIQLCPVCRFTFAYSKGFSTIARAIPATIPARTVLFSRPPLNGISVIRYGSCYHLVFNASNTENITELWTQFPRKGGTIPL